MSVGFKFFILVATTGFCHANFAGSNCFNYFWRFKTS